MTLRQLADVYLERYVQKERKVTEASFKIALNTICKTAIPQPTGGSAAFGDWRVTDVVTDTIKRFREERQKHGTGPVGVNRNLGSLRALFNWALGEGYVEQTPFVRASKAMVKFSEEKSRDRRLNGDVHEEAKLLAACNPHLRAVVECALQTGMRRGEILSLQWEQVVGMIVETQPDGSATVTWAPRAELVLPWAKTKTREDRHIPINTRLKAILEMRRFDPTGQPMPAGAYVFGTEIGTRIKDMGRAWENAVLRAHGHKPTFTKTCNLTPESRAALGAIDLHFHDLRREAGSRWLEGGVPLHVVKDWLGHTNISQTSTYLGTTLKTQHDAMIAFEVGRAALQQIATAARKQGRRRRRTARPQPERLNRNAVGREPAIM